MLKIFSGRNVVKEISKIGIGNIRKYGSDCPKPQYECPHKKKPDKGSTKREVHPFLRKDDCKHASKFWKIVFFAVCVPSMIAGYIIAFYTRPKEKRAPFLEYSHMRIRNKPFPWGDGNKTLFHNPHMNALPTGYETDDEDDD